MYGRVPTPNKHWSRQELQKAGDLRAKLRAPKRSKGEIYYAGYMFFWAPGDWKLEAWIDNSRLGELVLRL